ncbi:MAG: DUF4423 domain-containing protein [Bdellovibrionaceae bacterium]|nr:DUF4423 domain-containing protein [Pseudobdellovibrionaceae bacterium]
MTSTFKREPIEITLKALKALPYSVVSLYYLEKIIDPFPQPHVVFYPMNTFAQALIHIYKTRKKATHSYSVRAFARDCRIPSPRMSDYFNGNRKIHIRAASAILKNLPMQENELQILSEGFTHSFSRDKKVYILSEQDFRNLYHPVYFAFLSQLETESGYQSDTQMAQALDLELENLISVKNSLLKTNLIKIVNNKIVPNFDRVETTFEISNDDIRRAQKASLQRIIDHVDHVDIKHRDITKYTIATDHKKIAQAKIRIQKFARKLADYLESGPKTEVFDLSIQLFPWRISK